MGRCCAMLHRSGDCCNVAQHVAPSMGCLGRWAMLQRLERVEAVLESLAGVADSVTEFLEKLSHTRKTVHSA